MVAAESGYSPAQFNAAYLCEQNTVSYPHNLYFFFFEFHGFNLFLSLKKQAKKYIFWLFPVTFSGHFFCIKLHVEILQPYTPKPKSGHLWYVAIFLDFLKNVQKDS